MKFNHNILFISSQYLDGDNPSQQVLEELQTELAGNDSNLLIVFYVQIMPDDFVMQLHRF